MSQGRILYTKQDDTCILKFIGDVRLNICLPLCVFSDKDIHELNFKEMLVDLTDAAGMDSTALGLLAKIAMELKNEIGCKPTIVCTDKNITTD